MKYYKVSIVVKDKQILFSDITEHTMSDEQFQSGVWERAITRFISGPTELQFISFERDYLDAMIAGIAIAKELQGYINE